jgi:hypothetical protein
MRQPCNHSVVDTTLELPIIYIPYMYYDERERTKGSLDPNPPHAFTASVRSSHHGFMLSRPPWTPATRISCP